MQKRMLDSMWLFVMFDLPVTDKECRKDYARFRQLILDEGFTRFQYSVYAKYFSRQVESDSYKRRLKEKLPTMGRVAFMNITDIQFGKIEMFCNVSDPPASEMAVEAVPEEPGLFDIL